MKICDEKYEKRFVFLECRFKDRKWFFCRNIMQYYCRSVDNKGYKAPWTKIGGKFYTEEELTVELLKGTYNVYLNKD